MDIDTIRKTPVRPVRLGTRAATVERQADGSMIYRLDEPLGPYPERLTDVLVHWATVKPDAVFLSQRRADGKVQNLTYAQALDAACRVGTALIARGLSAERPLMILSENDLEGAMLFLGALHAGVPYVPISPAYSLLATDFERVKNLAALMCPGMIFASDGDRFGPAMLAAGGNAELVTVTGTVSGRQVTPFADLLATHDAAAVTAAHLAIGPESIAKFLFTSGTTGTPKAVIFPQRMLTSQRQQIAQTFAFMQDEPVEMSDWLPWHHTFGGTHNIGVTLYSGGSLRIDGGRPVPGQFEESLRNIREISPNFYTNTPVALDMLVQAMRDDTGLRDHFFERMKFIYYGGAVLPAHVWYGLDEMSIRATGMRTMITSGVGCTEVGPTPTSANWDPEWTSVVGLPVPGVEVKIAPVEDKMELRFRSACVTLGYWKNPELTAAAFDDQGFYCTGDAVRMIDPDHPEIGLRYDGRISENFKLTNGTWVHVAGVRGEIIAGLAPLAIDAVIAGPNRAALAAIIFPNVDACRQLAGLPVGTPDAEVVAHPVVQKEIRARMQDMARAATGATRRVVRYVVTDEAAILDTGEITDKRVISQKTVLARRAAQIDALYADTPCGAVQEVG